MKTFWFKISILLTSLLAVLALPIWVLYQSGELLSVDEILIKQNTTPGILYAPAYNSFEKSYKFEKMLQTKPEVLALGASRLLNIRKEFFKSEVSFYNGGLLAKKIQNYRTILQKIPVGAEPRLIIMDVEQDEFNEAVNNLSGFEIENDLTPPSKAQYYLNGLIASWFSIYKDLWVEKFSLKELVVKPSNRLGVLAIKNNEGFRTDGSYRNGRYIENPQAKHLYDYQFQDTLALVEKKLGFFRPSEKFSEPALKELDLFLQECQARNIQVVGFIPPFAPTVFERLKADPALAYMFEVYKRVEPLFVKHGFEVYDVSNPSSFGSSDAEFLDALHASEKSDARIFLHIGSQSTKLSAFLDLAKIQKALEKSPNDFEVFGN